MISLREIHISPSILSADFGRLRDEVKEVTDHADSLHIDVMDGHFVPNISFGPVVVNSLRAEDFSLPPMDIHLMITDPGKYAPEFRVREEDEFIFHVEAVSDPADMISALRALGAGVGISLSPSTRVDSVFPWLRKVDEILVMGVEPGFGGQDFIPSTLETIKALRRKIDREEVSTQIAVDGGIKRSLVKDVVQAGTDVVVAGSAIYGQKDRVRAITEFRREAEKGLRND